MLAFSISWDGEGFVLVGEIASTKAALVASASGGIK